MQKKYEIDPVTGLRLEIVEPSPSPQAAIMTNLGMTDTGTVPPPPTPMVVEPFDPAKEQARQAVAQSAAPQGKAGSSFLDKVIQTLAGTPDSKLEEAGDTEALKGKASRRKAAAAASKSAAESPGDAYMEIPGVGSGEGGGQTMDRILQPIVGAISSLFGGGKGSGVG